MWLLILALLQRGGRMMPGSQVLGIGLGGRSPRAAQMRLEAHWEDRPIEVTLPTGNTAVPPAELGIYLDGPETIRSLWHAGRRSQDPWRRLWPAARHAISPSLGLDLEAGVATLQRLAATERLEAVDARLGIRDGALWAETGRPGLEIDVVATSIRLQAELDRIVEAGRLESILRQLPPRVADPEPARDRAAALLQQDLRLDLWDPVSNRERAHSVAAGTWRAWVRPVIDPASPGRPRWLMSSAVIDPDRIASLSVLDASTYVEPEELQRALVEALDGGRTELRLRLHHRPRQHQVAAGETLAAIGRIHGIPYPWIQAANPGSGDRLRAGQMLQIPPADHFIQRPIVEGKRIVVDLDAHRTRVYQDGLLRWDWPSSSGVVESPTAPGVYQVQSLEAEAYASAWQLRMPYFIGIYQPAPSATVTNGFHGQPIHDRLGPLWLGQIGMRVTYGCILLDDPNAAQLYEWAEPGVIVELRSASGPRLPGSSLGLPRRAPVGPAIANRSLPVDPLVAPGASW